MKKFLITGLMAVVAMAGVATSVWATPTAPAEPQSEQAHIRWGAHYTEASETAIPKEEAKQIGLNALAEFFGTDLSQLGDYTFEIGYNFAFNPWESIMSITQEDIAVAAERNVWVNPDFVPSGRAFDTIDDLPSYHFPMTVTRSTWDGVIIIPNNRTPNPDGIMLRGNDLFRFRIDAQTGELVGVQFFPSEDPIARPNMPSECMGSPLQVSEYQENMGAEHNIEYANFAMQFAEEASIFESNVLRAAVAYGGWIMGRNDSFELIISVAVESTTGETVMLTFQGRNRKELVGVDFFSRMIDHAIDRDGNITKPRSQFIGNPEISNWIYN